MHNIPVEGAVKQINRVLDTGTPEELMQWLQNQKDYYQLWMLADPIFIWITYGKRGKTQGQ